MGDELLHAAGRTDRQAGRQTMTKLVVAFRYVANTPKRLTDRHIPHRMLSHHVGTSVTSEKTTNFSKPVFTDVTFESSNNFYAYFCFYRYESPEA